MSFLILQDYISAGEVHFRAGDLLDETLQPIAALQAGGLAVIEFAPATMQVPLDRFLAYRNTKTEIGGEYLSSLMLEAGAFGVAGTPTGPAGGDLEGAYPDPLVQDLTITGELQGSVLYFDGTNWVQLQHGTANQVLTTQGITTAPLWRDLDTILPSNLVTGFQSEGTGEPVTRSQVGNTLTFKSIVAGDNITLSSDINELTVSATGADFVTTNLLWVDLNTPATLALQNGAFGTPFATIQQGIDAVPVGTTSDGARNVFWVMTASGQYDETITWDVRGRRIKLMAWGGPVMVGVFDQNTWQPVAAPATTPRRNIIITGDGDNVIDNIRSYVGIGTASMNGDPGGAVSSSFNAFRISGQIEVTATTTGNAGNIEWDLECEVYGTTGNATGVSLSAVNNPNMSMNLERCRFRGTFDSGTDGRMVQASGSRFQALLTTELLTTMCGCRIEGGLFLHENAGGGGTVRVGLFNCTFAGEFDGGDVAPEVLVDQATFDSMVDNGATFGVGAFTTPIDGIQVQNDGTPLTPLAPTFNFTGDGVTASVVSGVNVVNIPGGGGIFLPLAGGTMTGAIDMGANAITNAGAIGSTGFTGPLTGNVNGVAITGAGVATNYLDETGNYSVPPSTGDFTGPAGAVTGNLVSFADATGKLGADSGVLASAVSSHIASTSNPHSTSIANIGSGTLAQLNAAVTDATLIANTRNLTAGAGLTGGGDLSADRTFDVVANVDGSITVNANDLQVGVLATDAQHGVRGGGTQHAVAVASGAAGFISGASQQKLDDLITNAVPATRNLTAGAGLTGGGDLSADRTFDVVANADGSMVINANDLQIGILATDAQHGVRGGGTQHAVATGAVAGFMSAADKTAFDLGPFLPLAGGTMTGSIDLGAQAMTNATTIASAGSLRLQPVSGSTGVGANATPEGILHVFGGNLQIGDLNSNAAGNRLIIDAGGGLTHTFGLNTGAATTSRGRFAILNNANAVVEAGNDSGTILLRPNGGQWAAMAGGATGGLRFFVGGTSTNQTYDPLIASLVMAIDNLGDFALTPLDAPAASDTDGAGFSLVTGAGDTNGSGGPISLQGGPGAGTGTIGGTVLQPVGGHVCVGTSLVPDTRVLINDKIVDDAGRSYSEDALMVIEQTPTSDTALNDPIEVLYLGRQGTAVEAFGALATFKLSRYENVGTDSRTRLDLDLTHGAFTDASVATWLSSGNMRVGPGVTLPNQVLTVNNGGTYGAATGFARELSIQGAGNSGMTIFSLNTQTGSIVFGDNDAVDRGRVQYNHAIDSLQWCTAQVHHMTLNPTGELSLIGTVLANSFQSPFGGFGRIQNLLRESEDLNDADWQKLFSVAVTPNNALAPNGEMTADTVSWASATDSLGLRQVGVGAIASNVYTLIFWARFVSGSSAVLGVDVADGTTVGATIDSVMRRYAVTVTAGVGGDHVDITNAVSGGIFEIWGVQLVDGPDAFPYVRTENHRYPTETFGVSAEGDLNANRIVGTPGRTLSINAADATTADTGGSALTEGGGDGLGDGSGGTHGVSAGNAGAGTGSGGTSSRQSGDGGGTAGNSGNIDNTVGGVVSGVHGQIQDNTPAPDTQALRRERNTGTNPGTVHTFIGNRDPNGNVTGAGGDRYYRGNGATSASYESKEATTGTNWLARSTNPANRIEIHNSAEFEALATAGVITVSDFGTSLEIILKVDITTTSRFVVDGNDLVINAEYGQAGTLTYNGTATLFTVTNDGDVRIRGRARLESISTGTLIDFTGTDNFHGFDAVDSTIRGWDDLGTIRKGFFAGTKIAFIFYGAPLVMEDSQVIATDVQGVIGGNLLEFTSVDPTVTTFTNIGLMSGLFLSAPLVRIDPNVPAGKRMQFTNVSSGSASTLIFDVTGGATGAYTAVANNSIALTGITSVTDSAGNARFNHAGTSPIVGSTVVVSGFVTETSYNGTFICSASGAGFFELTGVAFSGDDATGSYAVTGITVTATAHGLSNSDTLQLNTTGATEYDGGYRIYNVQTNSFDVAATFGATRAGTWDTSGLDESNPAVLAFQTLDNKKSVYISAAFVNNNVTANGTIVNNTFTAMAFGTGGAGLTSGSTMERFKLIDPETGVFEYTGEEPFSGALTYDFTVVSSGGIVDFRFKWEKDIGAGFVDLDDAVEALAAVGSDAESVTKTHPLLLDNGDQIRPRITRNSGASGITTSYATIFATQGA